MEKVDSSMNYKDEYIPEDEIKVKQTGPPCTIDKYMHFFFTIGPVIRCVQTEGERERMRERDKKKKKGGE